MSSAGISNGAAAEKDLPQQLDDETARFVAVTNCPPEQAQFFLEAAGSFERALSVFYEQAPPHMQQEAYVAHLPPRPAAPAVGPSHRLRRGSLLQRLIALPAAALRTSLSLALGMLNISVSLVGFVAHRTLPPPMLHRLQAAAQALSQGETEADPRVAARAFASSFRQLYGRSSPDWVETGWQDATAAAARQYKFLLVYLHAADHEDTPKFCRETLAAPEVVDHLTNNVLAWGGDVRFSDAYRLSNSLKVNGYPFVGLLAFSGPRTRLVLGVTGLLGPAELVQALREAAESHGAEFVADRADASARDFDRRLREEQDAEFQRSLEADRQREAEAMAAAEQQAAAAREAARAESHARAQQQAAAAAAEAKRSAVRRRRDAAAARLAPEPREGSPDTSLVRVRFPSGTNFQRRFRADDTLQAVFDFVDAQEDQSAVHYSLASNFPRRVFSVADSASASLQLLGLTPQALLFVQPADDD